MELLGFGGGGSGSGGVGVWIVAYVDPSRWLHPSIGCWRLVRLGNACVFVWQASTTARPWGVRGRVSSKLHLRRGEVALIYHCEDPDAWPKSEIFYNRRRKWRVFGELRQGGGSQRAP